MAKQEKSPIEKAQQLLVKYDFLPKQARKSEKGEWGPRTAGAWRRAVARVFPGVAAMQRQPSRITATHEEAFKDYAQRIEDDANAEPEETEGEPTTRDAAFRHTAREIEKARSEKQGDLTDDQREEIEQAAADRKAAQAAADQAEADRVKAEQEAQQQAEEAKKAEEEAEAAKAAQEQADKDAEAAKAKAEEEAKAAEEQQAEEEKTQLAQPTDEEIKQLEDANSRKQLVAMAKRETVTLESSDTKKDMSRKILAKRKAKAAGAE